MNTAKRLPTWGAYLLLAYMPFHIFLAQSLSLITGGLNEWKVAKDVVLFLFTILTLGFVYLRANRPKRFNTLVILVATYGLIHAVVWGLNRHIHVQTALLGTAYNLRVVCFAILGYGAVLLWPEAPHRKQAIKLVLVVSTAVSILAVLQYLLPKDILTHVGYSLKRGVRPAFFIDDKPDLPRVMATLRDPNSLGAYLLLPICLLMASWHKSRQKLLFSGLILLHVLALLLTFSRGALLGLVLMIPSYYLLTYGKKINVQRYKKLLVGGMLAVILLGTAGYVFRNQYVVQNVILHSDKSTVAKQDSNDLHASLVVNGLKGIVRKPLGHGPGTAGVVSIRNPGDTVLTENYYVQIGYEVGVIGLLLFLLICYVVITGLRRQAELTRCLLAVFASYSVMALIMHLWVNEAVAAQWWIMAGISLGSIPKKTTRSP